MTHPAGRPVSGYTYAKGCRCDGCKAAHAAHQRTYRKALKVGVHQERAEVRVQCWCGREFPYVPVANILDPLYCSPECDTLPALSREPKERT